MGWLVRSIGCHRFRFRASSNRVLRNVTEDNIEAVETPQNVCQQCHGNHYVTLSDGITTMCERCYVG